MNSKSEFSLWDISVVIQCHSSGVGGFVSDGSTILYSIKQSGAVVKGYEDPHASVPLGTDLQTTPLVVASRTTINGQDGGWIRMSSATSSSVTGQKDSIFLCATIQQSQSKR